MTRGVLLDSENPEKSLEEMGMNSEFALLKGTNFYQKYKMIDLDSKLMEKEFYPNYNFVYGFELLLGKSETIWENARFICAK